MAITTIDILKESYETGFSFEKTHHGCAQCVIGALYELFPEMKNDGIFLSASGLAAGTGLSTKGQCGTISGAVMVLGQLYGRQLCNIADPSGNRFVAYRLAEKLVHKFIEEYGGVICAEIQKKLMGKSCYLFDPEQFKSFEQAGGHSWHCPSVVGNATRWAAKIMKEQKAIENNEMEGKPHKGLSADYQKVK